MTFLGININPWANAVVPNPPAWRGKCDHVRLVLNRTIVTESGSYRIMTEDETVDAYAKIARVYQLADMSCLLVVNQQTYGDGQETPWSHSLHWQDYNKVFSAVSARLIKRLSDILPNLMVQIWNEPDAAPPDAHSSVPLTAATWGVLHNTAAKAIRAVAPNVPILAAGFCTGSGHQANYWLLGERAAGGKIEADYFCTHPYGRYVSKQPHLPGQWYGTMEQHFFTLRQRVKLPMWVTEWSVYASPSSPLDMRYDQEGARLMKELWQYMDAAPDIRGATYFAAVDTGGMYAGLYTTSWAARQHMVGQFLNLKNSPPLPTPPSAPKLLTRFDNVNLRNARATCGRIIHIIHHAGTELECLDKNPESRVGSDDDWFKVRVGTTTGYIRADMVRLA